MKKILISQFIILLAGTLFAWGNFGYELYNWLKAGKENRLCYRCHLIHFLRLVFSVRYFSLSLLFWITNFSRKY